MTEDIGPFQKPTMDMNTGRPQEGPRSSTWKDFSFFWPTVTVLFIHILSLSPIYLYLSVCLSSLCLSLYFYPFISLSTPSVSIFLTQEVQCAYLQHLNSGLTETLSCTWAKSLQ